MVDASLSLNAILKDHVTQSSQLLGSRCDARFAEEEPEDWGLVMGQHR